MNELPGAILFLFLLTALLTVALFYLAVRGSRVAIGSAIIWITIQSALSLRGFYLTTDTLPPRFILAVAPPLILIALIFLTKSGRSFLDQMDMKWMVLIHTIRLFVEVTLFLLFLQKQVPALLTFEGGNLDILSGLTAPLIWWLYKTRRIERRGLLIWNSLCFFGVINAVVRALLSAPFRFQRFGFEQPTIAILHFPFILLPAFIVPAVILCHAALFRQLTGKRAQLSM